MYETSVAEQSFLSNSNVTVPLYLWMLQWVNSKTRSRHMVGMSLSMVLLTSFAVR